MPTNRQRTMRGRVAGGDDIVSWLRWHTGILRFIHINIRGDSPWTPETSMAFWKKNKKVIMRTYLDQNKEKNRPFLRPDCYLEEIETQFPRLKVGSESWIGPIQSDGSDRTRVAEVYESDEAYLRRMGLAEDWEVKTDGNKSPKKKKNK